MVTSSRKQQRLARIALRLALILVGAGAILRGCLLRPATAFPGAHFNRGSNAIWLGVEWVNQPHSIEQITDLANTLNAQQIHYVFAYTSYLKSDGQFSPTYSHAREFIQALVEMRPRLKVQAWIGLPLEHVNLNDSAVRKQIAEFCATLVQEKGFDGVHLDPEPVISGNGKVLDLLDEVRVALGPGPTLSIAARRIWPVFPNVDWPIVGMATWRTGYYREIASRVNQIVVMTYDSGMPLAILYRQWSRFQVIETSRAVQGTNAQLFLGVPTSEERTYTHWPHAENMRSGLQGIIDGLNDTEAYPAAVVGVAIYPHWETDETEWAIYQALWLGQARS